MGSFNMTCSISRLPITYGMPMRAFVLARQRVHQEFAFHTDAFYIPLTMGIKGQYDDYGGIEKYEVTESFKLQADFFFPQLKCHYDPLARSGYGVHSDEPKLKAKGMAGYDIALAFVREDVYQAMMKLKPLNRDDVKADLERFFSEYSKWAKMLSKVEDREGVDRHIKNAAMSTAHEMSVLGSLFRAPEGSTVDGIFEPLREKLVGMVLKGGIDDKALDFAMEVAEFLQLNRIMHELCIAWQPTTNMVGQETPYSLQKAFNRAIHGICVQEVKEQEEDAKEDRASQREYARQQKAVTLKRKV